VCHAYFKVGGYQTISELYNDPDQLDIISDERMKMLARSLMEVQLSSFNSYADRAYT